MKLSRNKKFIILFGLFILCISGYIFLQVQKLSSYINPETPISEFESEDYQEDLKNHSVISSVEGNAEFKFPPSSRDIYSYTTGFQDIYIQVRFTIAKEDLQEFINSTRCDTPLDDFLFPDMETNTRFSWWEVAQSKNLKRCSGATDHFGQEVFVDMSNQEFYIVYVSGGTH